ERKVLSASRGDRGVAQPSAVEVHGLAEVVAGPVLIELGPEETEEGIAPVGPGRLGGGQVSQQSQALRLREHAAKLLAVPATEVDRPKQPDGDHGGSRVPRSAPDNSQQRPRR